MGDKRRSRMRCLISAQQPICATSSRCGMARSGAWRIGRLSLPFGSLQACLLHDCNNKMSSYSNMKISRLISSVDAEHPELIGGGHYDPLSLAATAPSRRLHTSHGSGTCTYDGDVRTYVRVRVYVQWDMVLMRRRTCLISTVSIC